MWFSVCFGRVSVRGLALRSGFRMAHRRIQAPSTKSRTLSRARKERNGLPELHVWINQTIPSFQPEPPRSTTNGSLSGGLLKRFIEHCFLESFTERALVSGRCEAVCVDLPCRRERN